MPKFAILSIHGSNIVTIERGSMDISLGLYPRTKWIESWTVSQVEPQILKVSPQMWGMDISKSRAQSHLWWVSYKLIPIVWEKPRHRSRAKFMTCLSIQRYPWTSWGSLLILSLMTMSMYFMLARWVHTQCK